MKTLLRGIWRENPVLRLMLGLCPTLAVSSAAENGLWMGLAATFVLIGSNSVISVLRNFIPSKIRIPAFIVIIATFVTVVDMLLEAFAPPEIYMALGIFIPLIVVNCIILGRAEAYASKNPLLSSILDAIGMGAGFTLTLLIVGSIREVLGAGTIFGFPIMNLGTGGRFDPALIMIMAPGAFITLGLLMALMNWVGNRPAGGTE